MKNHYGIIQGRLTKSRELQAFPSENWKNEFSLAKTLKFSFIELLTEREHNEDNPFWSLAGVKTYKKLINENSLINYSVCADYIINHSLIGNNSFTHRQYLENFIEKCIIMDCQVIILPFLEKNEFNQKNINEYEKILLELSDKISQYNIKICIETLLDAKNLKDFLNRINKENIKCVYDTGNRAMLKNDLKFEINHLNNLIGHVHIKDKNLKGENVMLGNGNVDFKEAFNSLKNINYTGPYVFETTRGLDPIDTASKNIIFCNEYLSN